MATAEAATSSDPTQEENASAFDDSTFTETFGTFTLDEDPNSKPDLETYDPFAIGTSPPRKKSPSKTPKDPHMEKIKVIKKEQPKPQSTNASAVVPPRLTVNFKIHEEISSVATTDPENEGSSDISVQGGILAQITSSDALKNSPFILLGKDKSGRNIDIIPNLSYTRTYETRGQHSKVNVIKIQKNEVGFVPVGSYRFTERIDHMPLLLEKRVTRKQNKVQVAIQVRSKLTNAYDLTDLSITLALSEPVIEELVEINVGEGEFDKIKRTITWKLTSLEKGDSFMVSARGVVNDDTDDEALKFPVILRCSSLDQISTGQFAAIEASGYPATLTSTIVSKTFRMIHRLK